MAVLLALTVLLPLVAGVILLSRPSSSWESARGLALATALATLAIGAGLAWNLPEDGAEPAYHGALTVLSLGQSGKVQVEVGLDGLSAWLFAMTPLLVLASLAASWSSLKEKAPTYYGLVLALQAGLMGLFAAQDILLFYIAFEITLIPSFLLIAWYGGPERRPAAITFVIYTLAGSLLTLVGIVALVTVHWAHSPFQTLTFSIPELTQGLAALDWEPWRGHGTWLRPSVQGAIFLLLLAGFAVKTPIFPFHSWLPPAYQQAPTAITILIAGVMSKLGAYGLVRFNLAMTPLAAQDYSGLVATLAVIGILYGALNALAQTDLKALVAYSSLSHMGFIVLGLFALNAAGLNGASIQMVNHAVTTGALFLLVAMTEQRYRTTEMTRMGGVWKSSPAFAFFLIVTALASAGVPGLNGFVGEFPILAGAFRSSPAIGTWAALGMILGAWYLIGTIKAVAFGPDRRPEGADWFPPSVMEGGVLALLASIMLWIGIRPNAIFDDLKPVLEPIAAAARATGEAPAEPANLAIRTTTESAQ